jgi:hypothetical protein
LDTIKRHGKATLILLLVLLLLSLIPDTAPPPKNLNNACSIFKAYPRWYWDTKQAQKKWGVPISVQLAIIDHESHFEAKAQTEHKHFLGLPLPWTHISSARGYAQALDSTWALYQKDTEDYFESRASFKSATQFIGWFSKRAHSQASINEGDTTQLYLAYHEGIAGYMQASYNKKPWLLKVAQNVGLQAHHYRAELEQCQSSLPKDSWRMYW